MHSSKFSLVLSLTLFSILSACDSKPVELAPPNIVWITSEDNSKHYMDLFDDHGTQTPNIEKLADHGIRFTHAFSNAAVCSAARSTLISGSYGPRLGTHYHRKLEKVPMPEGQEMFPYYLKQAGYHTTNNSKEDYNIFKSDSVWDESSKKATWKTRKPNQPFFHVFNIGTTHEGKLHFTEEDVKAGTKTNPDSTFIFPNHPQTELFKYTNALYLDKIKQMDAEVGQVVDELKKEGLLENTFIFYFGDHGGVLPGSKGYLYESGLHVPLVVYIPSKYENSINLEPNTRSDAFVSFVDFGPTVLNLAGATIPEGIDGKPFLGKDVTKKDLANKNESFSYADRFDEKYDMVRALRKGKYKYIRNYQAFNFDGLMNEYRYKQPGYREWKNLYEAGELNAIQSQFFEPKPVEALYDLEADPYETNNLANKEGYANTLLEMRENLNSRVKNMPDLSFYPEFYLIENAFENPTRFGQRHKTDIQNYIDIANLSLGNFNSVKSKIETSLKSSDPWIRYWALITCSNFGKDAIALKDQIKTMSITDNEAINRVRAAEFLGLIGAESPIKIMTDALYNTEDSSEALLILNSMTLMKECKLKYAFDIDRSRLKNNMLSIKLIKIRVDYLAS
ncbi:sulfatase-like hydrolase/transferase [Algibacter mikhailovii]|uniref:Sulfatase n=1 Tax=Algibacter mikhailovii TaxID=425498 RepID=A0A918VD43_9FLAO|nr:sulfatase-like hydrolase/transferase [Algibacter mikhailovii]GGZ87959.1 sulfatase [Algibacter mikhailovii]